MLGSSGEPPHTGVHRALFVILGKGVARMGVAVRSLHKFSPPRVDTTCGRGEGERGRQRQRRQQLWD